MKQKKTSIPDFIDNYPEPLPARLRNVLGYFNRNLYYIEDITLQDLIDYPSVGPVFIRKFIEVTGINLYEKD